MLIKICGITEPGDAQTARNLGVSFLGFIFHPKSPRAIAPAAARAIETGTMCRVGVFVDLPVSEIRAIMDEARLDYAQLHGAYSREDALALGADRVIRVLWPERYPHKAALYKDLLFYEDSCSYYLFDAGTSGGGHGEKLDWEDLSGLRPPHPWFLAGGLNPGNIVRALWVPACPTDRKGAGRI